MTAMFSDVLGAFEGKFDARMMVTIFFPCLVFVMIVVGLIMAAFLPGPVDLANAWNGYPVEIQAFIAILALCLIMLIALVMSSLVTSIIRLYEGYWENLPLINKIGEARKQYYRQILDGKWNRIMELSKKAQASPTGIEGLSKGERAEMLKDYNDIYFRFPAPTRAGEVMPTRLGNIFKSSETYPSVRYGIDSVLIWPRLYPLLPQDFASSISAARSMVDMMVTISFLGIGLIVAALLWGIAILLAILFAPQLISSVYEPYLPFIFIATYIGGLIVCIIGYLGAIGSALGYGELIKTTFDLYRDSARKAMGFNKPGDMEAEYDLWSEASKFIHRDIPGEDIKQICKTDGGNGGGNQ